VPDRFGVFAPDPEDAIPVGQLIADFALLGARAEQTTDRSATTVVLLRDAAIAEPEGYRLTIAPDGVRVAAATAAGIYYGVQTLRDLLTRGRTLPGMIIEDAPDFQRRGVYLDCSRGKVPTVDTVIRWVERLARWKINEIQLYIENVFTFARHPQIGAGFSPFTPADIAAIQAACRQHHVTLVPSLASLGHMEKILMLPAYNHLGELPGYRDWPGGTTLNPRHPGTIALVADLYADFLPCFAATDFNVCGDEPWELGQGRSQADGPVAAEQLYLDFLLRLRTLCQQHGKRMNLWGDIVLQHPDMIPQIPTDLVLLNWDYEPDGTRMQQTGAFVEAGLPHLCCPGTHGWQSHGTRLLTSLRNIHQFSQIARQSGAAGLLNTDWGDNGHRNTFAVSLPALAYGAACAWNSAQTPAPDQADDFLRRFVQHVYGDRSGTLVDGIRAIGDEAFGYWAYHALLESLTEPTAPGPLVVRGRPVIAEVPLTDEALQTLQETQQSWTSAAAWSTGQNEDPGRQDPFTCHAREECALAARMNAAAIQRVLLARRLRTGGTCSAAAQQAHRKELLAIATELARLWSARYRPSRLADNLAALQTAATSPA
jgi:hypothetical protein